MYPALHIPDGFLAPQVALAAWIATFVVVGASLRRLSGVRSAASHSILMGIAGAFIFAAQMFNFPVAAGTSGHLLGGVLAGFLLGPSAGTLVMTTVIGIQALLFQDGGLLALGANTFNMGVIGTLGGTLVARGLAATLGGSRSATMLSVGVAAWLSVVAAAGLTTLMLGLSGTTDISIGLPAMLGTHALIGVGEALITIGALSFIAVSAPDIYRNSSNTAVTSLARRFVFGVSIAIAVATLASLFASASPDGLYQVAAQLGFLDNAQSPTFNLLPNYTIPGLDGAASKAVAGVVGISIVVTLLIALGKFANRTRGA